MNRFFLIVLFLLIAVVTFSQSRSDSVLFAEMSFVMEDSIKAEKYLVVETANVIGESCGFAGTSTFNFLLMEKLVHYKMYDNIKMLLNSNIPVFRLVSALTLLLLVEFEQVELSYKDMKVIDGLRNSTLPVYHCMGCTVHNLHPFSACFEASNPINQLIRSIPISEEH